MLKTIKMICEACNKVPYHKEYEDCFEGAIDVIKKHYAYYKSSLQQRDLELQKVKERNEKLNKALQLLQKNQQPSKRFKSQNSDESSLGNISSQDNRIASEFYLEDDDPTGNANLNMALNSEQLFDTTVLSQSRNDITMTSSETLLNLRVRQSPKRNKQLDTIRYIKDRNNKRIGRSKSEWHTKVRNSPAEKSWALKFLQPAKIKPSEEKIVEEVKKTSDKKLHLSLKKTNPSKMKQSLIEFNKCKDTSLRESESGEDIIDASPLVVTKNSKVGRSRAPRSGQNYCSNANNTTNETFKIDNANKSFEDIVFDFSPSKKTDASKHEGSPKNVVHKKIKFDGDDFTNCSSAPNDHLEILTNKSDSSSVVILTPSSQDIIFVSDTCNIEPEIDTMDLLGDIMKQDSTDNLEKLKKYESKCIQRQQLSKDSDTFKKPKKITQNNVKIDSVAKIKEEKTAQEILQQNRLREVVEEKPTCSKSFDHIKSSKILNPLFASDEQDTEDDEDFMPEPFIIKQEPESSKKFKKSSLQQRFNIDCEDCEKMIKILDECLTDAQIQQHLDKCKRHNNLDVMRQNTPKDFWNPFILSFQADDPRNEVLVDNRFKDNKK